jgi:REP element-mobilizing transposase RayT
MSWYRRIRTPGGTYFFTVVTHDRRPIFAEESARRLLHVAMDEARKRRPFVIDANCLLPDHIHAIWTLPEGDSDYSTRWAQIKGRFSHDYLATNAWANGPPYGAGARVRGAGTQSVHPTDSAAEERPDDAWAHIATTVGTGEIMVLYDKL